MAIIIPSKNIYGRPENQKVRNNFIDTIEYSAKNPIVKEEYETSVYTTTVSINDFDLDFYTEVNSPQELYSVTDMNFKNVSYVYYLNTSAIYSKGIITVPKNIKNNKIVSLNDLNNSFSLSGKAFSQSMSAKHKSYDEAELLNYNNVFDKKWYSDTLSISSGIITFPEFPIKYANGNLSGVKENKSYVKILSETETEYEIEFYILYNYAIEKLSSNDWVGLKEQGEMSGTLEKFVVENISFNFKGDRIVLELEDVKKKIGKENGKSPTSFQSNELIQTTNHTEGNSSDLTEKSYNNTLKQYSYGKETITLTCSIGEYKDENGNIVISEKNKDLPMVIKEGDIILPKVFSSNGYDVPISKYKDGTEKKFEVLKVEYIYDGSVMQKITGQEYTEIEE